MHAWSRVVLAFSPVVLGCAGGGGGLPAQLVESSYARVRGSGAACRSGDAGCCERQAQAARAAAASGQSASAAHLWQEVALACPTLSREAAEAANVIPPGADPAGAVLNVSYRVRLPPAVRLYWVSASVGGRLLPAGATAATQPLDVEVQAIRFSRGRPGPLLVVERRLDVAFQPGALVTIDIAEAPAGAPAPLAVSAQVQPPPAPAVRTAPAAQPRREPPPRLEPRRLVSWGAHRVPVELGFIPEAGLPTHRVCLDREGELDTVRFLEAPHPRVAASLIDQLRDERYEPYRVNDVAVPSCDVLRAEVHFESLTPLAWAR
jgi:hypothetical protein